MRARAARAFQALDLPTPENDAQFLSATESSLYLLEVLARIELPPPSAIPGSGTLGADSPSSWTVPHTELVLERFDSQSGHPVGYRFSAETIERLPEFHQRARGLPVKASLERFEGVVERFQLRPSLTAPGWLQALVQKLPAPWFRSVAGEPLWKWFALVATALAVLLAYIAVFRMTVRVKANPTLTTGSRGTIQLLLGASIVGLLAFFHYVMLHWIRLTGPERELVLGTLSVLTHLAGIWLLFLIAARVADAVIQVRAMGLYALDAQLVRLLTKLGAVFLSFYLLAHLAESLGIPVAPVLAGLGVGGLAVALAVRPTLENMVGGFVLFGDAPVRVGEFCQFGDKLGTVEAIGLRSVRLRGIDRTVITVPNADFCQLQLVNFSRRDSILLRMTLHLRYETTPDQLQRVLTQLRELLLEDPRVSNDPARVRLIGYGESALDVEIFALVQTRDFNEFLGIQEEINLRIGEIVESTGNRFAFPSQTLYLEQSPSVDEERSNA